MAGAARVLNGATTQRRSREGAATARDRALREAGERSQSAGGSDAQKVFGDVAAAASMLASTPKTKVSETQDPRSTTQDADADTP